MRLSPSKPLLMSAASAKRSLLDAALTAIISSSQRLNECSQPLHLTSPSLMQSSMLTEVIFSILWLRVRSWGSPGRLALAGGDLEWGRHLD